MKRRFLRSQNNPNFTEKRDLYNKHVQLIGPAFQHSVLNFDKKTRPVFKKFLFLKYWESTRLISILQSYPLGGFEIFKERNELGYNDKINYRVVKASRSKNESVCTTSIF